MSGGGGSGGGMSRVGGLSGGGGEPTGAERDVTPCANLRYRTYLHGVDPDVAEAVEPGNVLAVRYRTEPRQIAVETADGSVLGAILDGIQRLIECMQEGVGYVAEIVSLDDGVQVDIRPS